MRARKADYALLSQLSDTPYNPLDTCLDVLPTEGKRPDRSLSSSNAEGASVQNLNRNFCLERNYSISRASGSERVPLVAESILSPSLSRAHSSHLDRSACVTADRFAFYLADDRQPAEALDRFPVGIQQLKTLSFDYASKVGDGCAPPSFFLHRQSSGDSSFTESLLSSDVGVSTLSPTVSVSAADSALLGGYLDGNEGPFGIRHGIRSPNWAQQTEQSYNLQLTLALRLVSEAEISEEPLLVPCYGKEGQSGVQSACNSVCATALRFWVNGSLGYADRIGDGFYHIWGLNPHVWAICSDSNEGSGRLPRLDLLKAVDPTDCLMEVVTIDKHRDSHLSDIENQAFSLAFKSVNPKELAEHLGKLVSENLGGAAPTDQGELRSRWKAGSLALKECLNCIVVPLGSIPVGVCRHRALLYKTLADSVNLPCRITRGCKYCEQDDGVSCLVLCGPRELLVDLISNPGNLSSPEAFLKSQPLPSVASPLRLPELKASEISGHVRLNCAEAHGSEFVGWRSAICADSGQRENGTTLRENKPNNVLGGRSSATPTPTPVNFGACLSEIKHDSKGLPFQAIKANSRSLSPPLQFVGEMDEGGKCSPECKESLLQLTKDHSSKIGVPAVIAKMDPLPQQSMLQSEMKANLMDSSLQEANCAFENQADPREESEWYLVKAKSLEQSLALDGLEITWEELDLKERIGAGSFGTVHRADWNGSDVAVKVFIEQDFMEERLKEFMREVAIMQRTRHPNVVLFMGAVTKWPNLSIVTEYLPRGSLFQLLHRAGVRQLLDEKRRIRMALDVAKGMNYLHRMNPSIVHRDLKSPNLLVDKTWTVKVCDFGLSRLKPETFLSSRSAAGTAEWMAPEVLRDEPSNEKADVYSFGVILWEIFTFQKPWSGLSPAQVVGAVGFQHRRLQIPKDLDADLAALIESCWASDPRQRPSFTSIMDCLRPLQRISGNLPVAPS